MASSVTGFSPLASPGEAALSAVVALSIGQLWAALLGRNPWRGRSAVLAVAGTFASAFLAFALYRGASLFLEPVLGHLSWPEGPLAWISASVPVGAMVVLTVVHAVLPSMGRSVHVHALNGFYFGAIADRLVDQVWGRWARIETEVERA